MQIFRIAFFGLGTIFGSVFTAVATEYYTPYVCFGVNMFTSLLLVITGFKTSDELENNSYATMID